MAGGARKSAQRPRTRAARATTYWDATLEPLCNFVFLLPIVVAYESGALLLRLTTWMHSELVAERLVRSFLSWFGAGGLWLPGVALLLTLGAWHWLSRRSWQLRAWIPLAMALESVLAAVPLYALNAVRLSAFSSPELPPVAAGLLCATDAAVPAAPALAESLVLALGAGIYEEALFRLGLVSALLWIGQDLLRLPRLACTVCTITVGGALFALCHYAPLGNELFAWDTFVQRSLAGAYLSLLFVHRGIGVPTGSHAFYNVAIVAVGFGAPELPPA